MKLSKNKLQRIIREEIQNVLNEVSGSQTKEGQEIINWFKKELGLGSGGRAYLEQSLDTATPRTIRRAYNYFNNTVKQRNPTPQDIATVNDILRGNK